MINQGIYWSFFAVAFFRQRQSDVFPQDGRPSHAAQWVYDLASYNIPSDILGSYTHIILYCIVSYYIMLYYTILYCIILYYSVLYYIILYYIMLIIMLINMITWPKREPPILVVMLIIVFLHLGVSCGILTLRFWSMIRFRTNRKKNCCIQGMALFLFWQIFSLAWQFLMFHIERSPIRIP